MDDVTNFCAWYGFIIEWWIAFMQTCSFRGNHMVCLLVRYMVDILFRDKNIFFYV